MKLSETVKKINKCPIDWCVNCALAGTDAKDAKKLMFTYWAIQQLRSLPKSNYGFFETLDTLNFTLKLDLLKENKNLQENVTKKSYWKFMKHLLQVHLDNNGFSEFIPDKICTSKSKELLHISFKKVLKEI